MATSPSIPSPGDPAPDFATTDQDGKPVSKVGLLGQKVVLYFYPKDDTPGCTAQACSLRDNWSRIQETGATLFGVSPGTAAEHKAFQDKFALPFPLLADPDHKVSDEFGVYGEQTFGDQTFEGVERTTFLIGEDGNVTDVMRNVDPSQHTDQVIEALRG